MEDFFSTWTPEFVLGPVFLLTVSATIKIDFASTTIKQFHAHIITHLATRLRFAAVELVHTPIVLLTLYNQKTNFFNKFQTKHNQNHIPANVTNQTKHTPALQ
jgi:hypothetical protein